MLVPKMDEGGDVIRTAIVGLGKMGISHLALFRSHPSLKIVAACDPTKYVTDVLTKYTGLKCYADFDAMLANEQLDAVVISTPSKFHAHMVRLALDRGLHVFCEKPFVLDATEGEGLVALASQRNVVTQVGYHYRFVGAFREAARIVQSGALGQIHHLRAEAFGPVVLRPKGGTWRSDKAEGGGALYDYACHAIDLANLMLGPPASIGGVVRQSIFSKDVDDEVYCSLFYANGASGQLSINWSDESYRKMSTKISVWGTLGRVVADRQECQIWLKQPHTALPGVPVGWTIRYTTDLSEPVWYYLRGEEYSAQVDYFAQSILQGRLDGENNFASALETDRVVRMILAETTSREPTRVVSSASLTAEAPRRGLFARIFG